MFLNVELLCLKHTTFHFTAIYQEAGATQYPLYRVQTLLQYSRHAAYLQLQTFETLYATLDRRIIPLYLQHCR